MSGFAELPTSSSSLRSNGEEWFTARTRDAGAWKNGNSMAVVQKCNRALIQPNTVEEDRDQTVTQSRYLVNFGKQRANSVGLRARNTNSIRRNNQVSDVAKSRSQPYLEVLQHRELCEGFKRVLLLDPETSELYYTITNTPKNNLRNFTAWDWDNPPRRIQVERVVPKFSGKYRVARNFTEGPASVHHPQFYLKRPAYLAHNHHIMEGQLRDPYAPDTIAVIEREIKVCEILRDNPHPNICRYYGATLDDNGYVRALVFHKFNMNLKELVRRGYNFDAMRALRAVKAGLKHMHSLGLIHCDVKPENIFVFMPEEEFVIGDFDSTHMRGSPLTLKTSTPMWSHAKFEDAQPENDWYGLKMVHHWLKCKGFGNPVPGQQYISTAEFLAKAVREGFSLGRQYDNYASLE